MKRIFLPILALISLYLYFPIFCFVKEVTVEGNKLVPKDEIIKTSELVGKILAIHNKEDSTKRILNIKLIKNISFKQINFTKIKIVVEEKKIIMSAKIGNITGYIDQDSIFLRNIEEYIDESYPILSLESEDKIKDGVFLLNLLIKKGALETKEISEIVFDEILGVTIFTTQGVEIYLGEDKFEKKISNLIIILKDSKTKQMNESYIDVSNINKGVVNYNL